jgi:hypothetical protein
VTVAVGVAEEVGVAVDRLTGVTAPQLIMAVRSRREQNNKTIRLKPREDFRFAGVIEVPGSRITEVVPFIQWD